MIILYGKLREAFGKTINARVHSVQELIRAAEANRPGFRNHIRKDGQYLIRRGIDFRQAVDVGEEEVAMRFRQDTWHVLPMPIGYSGGARILAGVVLVTAGAIMSAFPVTAPFAVYAYAAGASLIVGGVASLLMPVPSIGQDNSSSSGSYLFDAPETRTTPGTAIPLIYGKKVYVQPIFHCGGLDVGDIT